MRLTRTLAAVAATAAGLVPLSSCGSSKHHHAAASVDHDAVHVGGSFAPVGTGRLDHDAGAGLASIGGIILRDDPTVPNRVVAIGAGNSIAVGTVDAAHGTFSIDVPPGMPCFLGFYHNTSFLYSYGYTPSGSASADETLDTLPLSACEADESIDLGFLAANGTRIEPPSDPSSLLHLGTGTSAMVQRYDQLLSRFQNIDVDGSGEFDFVEGRRYDFFINYMYALNVALSVACDNQYCNAAQYVPRGYMFYAPVYRDDVPADLITTDGGQSNKGGPIATLTMKHSDGTVWTPAPLRDSNWSAHTYGVADDEDGYQRRDSGNHGEGWYYNFFTNYHIDDTTTFAGDYLVTIHPVERLQPFQSGVDSLSDPTRGDATAYGSSHDWACTLTYKNVPAATVGAVTAAPKPVLRINHDATSGLVTSIDYQWKTFVAGTGWVDMTDIDALRAYVGAGMHGDEIGGIELATQSGSLRWELHMTGLSGRLTVADAQDASDPTSFPTWSALTTTGMVHVNWNDFTGLSFGIDMR